MSRRMAIVVTVVLLVLAAAIIIAKLPGGAPPAPTPTTAGSATAPPANAPTPPAPADAEANAPAPVVNEPALPSPGEMPPDHPPIATSTAAKTSIQWLGHACFYIHSPGGNTVVTDPYDADATGYRPLGIGSHLVTVSSERLSHGFARGVRPFADAGGALTVLRGTDGGRGDLRIHAIATEGQSGRNWAYLIQSGPLRIVHLGALARPLTGTQIAGIGRVDVLMLPVGGGYALDGPAAAKVAAALNPKLILPTVYRTEATAASLAASLLPLEQFVAATPYALSRKSEDIVMVGPDDLPSSTEIWRLRYRR